VLLQTTLENGTFSRHNTTCDGGCTFNSHSGIFQLIVPRAVLRDDYNNQIYYSTKSEAFPLCPGTDYVVCKFVIFSVYFTDLYKELSKADTPTR